nr:hypothetical protein BdHM001_36410 [Bdellovibrio sp. HM001]
MVTKEIPLRLGYRDSLILFLVACDSANIIFEHQFMLELESDNQYWYVDLDLDVPEEYMPAFEGLKKKGNTVLIRCTDNSQMANLLDRLTSNLVRMTRTIKRAS